MHHRRSLRRLTSMAYEIFVVKDPTELVAARKELCQRRETG